MRTIVVPDPLPAEFEELFDRRRRWGVDRHDEVWDGVLHVNPAAHGRHAKLQAQIVLALGPRARDSSLTLLGEANLGEAGNFRIPDASLQRPGPDLLFYPTAALAVEVVSPGDETWDKLGFYAAHGVDEVLIVDPQEQAVHWLVLAKGGYRPTARSCVIDLGREELAALIDWPPLAD